MPNFNLSNFFQVTTRYKRKKIFCRHITSGHDIVHVNQFSFENMQFESQDTDVEKPAPTYLGGTGPDGGFSAANEGPAKIFRLFKFC